MTVNPNQSTDPATDLAVKYGGSVSGEHGDGRARTQWNRKLYGDHVWEVFRDLKTAFDPDWLLKPGSVCGDFDMSENLRFGESYEFDAGFERGFEAPRRAVRDGKDDRHRSRAIAPDLPPRDDAGLVRGSRRRGGSGVGHGS